jgi:hypothetical protein
MIALAITEQRVFKALRLALLCGRHGVASDVATAICAALTALITSASADQVKGGLPRPHPGIKRGRHRAAAGHPPLIFLRNPGGRLWRFLRAGAVAAPTGRGGLIPLMVK